MSRRRTLQVLFLIIGIATALAVPTRADTIALAWDDNNDPAVTGYRLYYGTSSGNYTQTQDAGPATQALLQGLASCTDYYVSVKAYVADGTESALFATEVSGWPKPIVGGSNPQNVGRGSTVDLALNGANFRPGMVVTVSNPGVTVNSVTAIGCHQLGVNVSVSSGAALGPFDVTVTDPDGIVGTGSGVASVTNDTTAPAISNVQAVSVGSTTATIAWTTNEPADGRVYYRKTGATAYQVSALDVAPATAHSIGLFGLAKSSTYEYYVESADAVGNSATANGPATFTTSTNSFNYLSFEPENVPLTAPAESVAGADAFGGAWLQVQQGTAAGSPGNPSVELDYGVSLPSPGGWFLWFRMYGVGGNANEWFHALDGGSFSSVQPSQDGAWEWVQAGTLTAAGGHHILTLGGAEARARIDRVLLTDDPGFVPSEQAVGDVTPPAAVGSLSAAPDDTTVALGWTNPPDGDLARVVVRFRMDGTAPTSPIDGAGVIDRPATSGAADGATHSGLTNGLTISYAVFAIDSAGNVSPVATIDATPDIQQTPPPEQVQNLHRTDNGG